jgi:uncharacterized protein YdeI (YjbR/CyaY-like superfamily)
VKIVFFLSASDLRKWFEKHHTTTQELWVGYYKKDSGKRSITWPESVDEALCVGWIDGIRKRLDDCSYMIRFSPRKPGSIWGVVNVRRAQALIGEGRMGPSGLKAFQARRENKSGVYSYEQRQARLEEPFRSLMRKNKMAWDFFQAQPSSYKKAAGWWVISAKKQETRLKRLDSLIQDSARELRIAQFTQRKPSQ